MTSLMNTAELKVIDFTDVCEMDADDAVSALRETADLLNMLCDRLTDAYDDALGDYYVNPPMSAGEVVPFERTRGHQLLWQLTERAFDVVSLRVSAAHLARLAQRAPLSVERFGSLKDAIGWGFTMARQAGDDEIEGHYQRVLSLSERRLRFKQELMALVH